MRAGDASGGGLQPSERAGGIQEASRERILELCVIRKCIFSLASLFPPSRPVPPSLPPLSQRARGPRPAGRAAWEIGEPGEGKTRCPTARQGAPHCICPSSRDGAVGPGSGPSLLAKGEGRRSLPSPPPEVPWLSLFCQGDLFNHLIFWCPFIPCFHGYGPIKGRSNKAVSQTGNKNIKAHVHRGRAGGWEGGSAR